MPELKEVFEMVSEKIEPDLDAPREQQRRQRRAARIRKVGAYVLTAGIALATIAVIVEGLSDPHTKSPEPAVNPARTPAENAARDLVAALGAFNADRVMSALADDADVAGLVTSLGDEGLNGTPDELPLFISMLEAMRFEESIGFCQETGGSTSGTEIRCSFSFYLLGSEVFGRGAFRGSYLDVTVRDGQIVRASAHWDTEKLSPQMWEPFARWVSRVYPGDVDKMYEDETRGAAHLSEQSIRLWKHRVTEFAVRFASNPEPPIVGKVTRTVDGVPFSLQVPTADWYQFGLISLNKSIVGPQGAEAIIFWTSFPDGGDAEACAGVLDPATGLTAADLAAEVATAPGTELTSGPTDVAIGGRPAKKVVLTVREDAGCDPGYFFSWHDMDAGPLWPETPIGATIKVWIVDIGGSVLVIEAETNELADAELEQEIEQIVGSIRFE
jgi:hypothetical protein